MAARSGGEGKQSRQRVYSALLGGGPDGTAAALRIIDGQVRLQALVMTFNDLFLAAAVITALTVPLVLFLKPMEPGAAPVMGH